MEKAKACWIYYSNRYLSENLDEYINSSFGEIFPCIHRNQDIEKIIR